MRRSRKSFLLAAALLAMLSSSSFEALALTWHDHACWCRTHHRKGHGLQCAYPPENMVLSRRAMTENAIRIAQNFNGDAGFAYLLACQCQNPGAVQSLVQNKSAVIQWLLQGGPC